MPRPTTDMPDEDHLGDALLQAAREVQPPETVGVPGVALQQLLDAYAALSTRRPGVVPTEEQTAAWDSAYDTLADLLQCT